MADPQFPIVVPNDQIQEAGVIDTEPIHSTFHGPVPGQVRFGGKEPPAVPADPALIRPTS